MQAGRQKEKPTDRTSGRQANKLYIQTDISRQTGKYTYRQERVNNRIKPDTLIEHATE